jgi:AmmeMemoRadiSam system protein A
LVTGRVAADAVADVLDRVWGGPETAIVVSTDLSHYHDHATATRLDQGTADAIVARDPDGIGVDRACGVFALRGLLVGAQRRRLDVTLLDLRTSGDTAGPRDRVVGYGAFALCDSGIGRGIDLRADLAPAEADVLLDMAEAAIRAGLAGQELRDPEPASVAPELLRPSGVFVTLEVAGALNGCIGTIEAIEPLAAAVPRLAASAAFGDPRLPPLTPDDLPHLTIKVSLLSDLEPLPAATRADVVDRLRIGVDGLVLAAGRRRATFLPSMWRSLPEPAEFVDQLLRKAGLPTTTWPEAMQAWTYTTVEVRR